MTDMATNVRLCVVRRPTPHIPRGTTITTTRNRLSITEIKKGSFGRRPPTGGMGGTKIVACIAMRTPLLLILLALTGCETHRHQHYWYHQKHHIELIPPEKAKESPTHGKSASN